MPINALRPG